MMTIQFNDTLLSLSEPYSLADLLRDKMPDADPCYAVSLNREFVPKSDMAHITLKDRDVVEIITPMQGG